MILFININGRGGSSWYVGPLVMFIVPYLLNGGINQLINGLLLLVAGVVGTGHNWLAVLLVSLIAAGLLAASWAMCAQMRRTGLGQMLQQVLFTGLSGASNAATAAATQQQPQQQQRRTAEQRQQRWDKVVRTLQKLPTDTVVTRAELEHLSTAELKQRLKQQGIKCSGCLEKSDLVAKLLEAGGSSGSSCSICCEDYVAGDVVRVLLCKHRYHIECVDRWFLSSTDYSREPACPICNAGLLQE